MLSIPVTSGHDGGDEDGLPCARRTPARSPTSGPRPATRWPSGRGSSRWSRELAGCVTRASAGTTSSHDLPGLPERVTIYEVGPRDGLQNESGVIPTDTKATFVRRLLEAGLPVVEATSFVHPRWVPQLADAADLMAQLAADLGDRAARAAGAGAQRAWPRPGAGAGLSPRGHLRQRHRDLRAAQPQPQPRRAVRDVRAGGPPCSRRRARRARLRLHVLRRPLGGRGAAGAGGRRRHPPARPGRVAAQHRRHHRRRHRRPRAGPDRGLRRAGRRHRTAGDALPRHLRPGAGQLPGRPPGRHHHLRRQRGRARWLPLRPLRDRQPRHRGPGLDAHRPRHRARRRSRLPGRHQRLDGRPARPAQPVRGRPGPRRRVTGRRTAESGA